MQAHQYYFQSVHVQIILRDCRTAPNLYTHSLGIVELHQTKKKNNKKKLADLHLIYTPTP